MWRFRKLASRWPGDGPLFHIARLLATNPALSPTVDGSKHCARIIVVVQAANFAGTYWNIRLRPRYGIKKTATDGTNMLDFHSSILRDKYITGGTGGPRPELCFVGE
jgi:hypothetical protein